MICSNCKTENDSRQKFCKSCGDPLGLVCDRCGSVNRPEDNHCGTCGQALAPSLKQGEPIHSKPLKQHLIAVKQYTPAEIVELLSLRKALQEEKQPTVLNQNDIDNMFA